MTWHRHDRQARNNIIDTSPTSDMHPETSEVRDTDLSVTFFTHQFYDGTSWLGNQYLERRTRDREVEDGNINSLFRNLRKLRLLLPTLIIKSMCYNL